MSGAEVVLILVAGLACGAVNALAGGGSLILFPALVATGMGTLAANVTNSVSTWPGYVGSVGGFREELRRQRHRLRRLAVATVLGSAVGCALLLATPTAAFDAIVPVLVLLAAGLLAVQPAVARRVGAPVDHHRRTQRAQLVAIGFAAIYGGYFGAGLSVIILAVLAIVLDDNLTRLNALKQATSFTINVAAAIFFIFSGQVVWSVAAVMAVGALIGGSVGGRLAGRVKPSILRGIVVTIGVIIALIYLYRLFG